LFKKKIKTGFGSVWFLGQTGSNQFGLVCLGFSGLTRFFPVWLGFFSV
jgi:hypothetical protein